MCPRVQLTVQLRAICASCTIAKALDSRASAPCETARRHRFPNPVRPEMTDFKRAEALPATHGPRTSIVATRPRPGVRSRRVASAVGSAVPAQVRP